MVVDVASDWACRFLPCLKVIFAVGCRRSRNVAPFFWSTCDSCGDGIGFLVVGGCETLVVRCSWDDSESATSRERN